ncbi:serine/threonine-protein kinase [Streptomyces amritsarensis]|uniref:serine/threonine-protein kinase n=1 Tax=Streptomyces amritsarensis TaxID=681158 RepID=UPI0036C33540
MRTIDDRYELRTMLGQGSMGQVWHAWDGELKRSIAIKLIRPDQLIGPQSQSLTVDEIVARFRREAELGARFTHPNIPVLLDAQFRGSPKDYYMVWELVLGRDLGQLLQSERRLPTEQALSVARQTAEVLHRLHADPVIHRDLKPANIMVTDDGRVKVLDLGVAAVFGADHPRLTRAGQLLGTVAYMAPEQFGGTIVPQTDLYALGCLLYEMLAGEPPFTGDAATVMAGHHHRSPLPLSDLRPELEADIAALVMDLLAKDADHRPVSARTVLDRLAPHCKPITAAAAQGSSPPRDADGSSPVTSALVVSAPAQSTPALSVEIRMGQALALYDAGRFGHALPLYADLAAELTAAGADRAAEAGDCRAKAAYCHLRLGNRQQALADYQSLADAFSKEDPADAFVLDVRCRLGILQEAAGQSEAALETLANLYPLLVAQLGRNAEQSTEVRTALNRLRSAPRS